MPQFSSAAETKYRSQTDSHAKTAGITLNRRICHKCGHVRSTIGAKLTRGTSRHNPSVFICGECAAA